MMTTINNAKHLFTYLHERLLEGKLEVPAPSFFDLVSGTLIDQILDDGHAIGLELDQWEFVYSDLINPAAAGRAGMISKSMAIFLAEYLADLSTGGTSGIITIEQVLMTQIRALRWSDRFKFEPEGEFPTLELLPKFEKQMGIGVRLHLDEAAVADLHYGI